MKWLRLNWMWLSVLVLALAGFGYLLRDNIAVLFGGFEKSERGYSYRFVKGKKLEKIKGPGYHVVCQFVIIGPGGDTIINASKPGAYTERSYPVEAENFIDDAIQIAAAGAIVEIQVPTDSFLALFPNDPRLSVLPPGKIALYTIHVMKILNDQDYKNYKHGRVMERVMKENDIIDVFADKKKDVRWMLDTSKWVKYYIINPNQKDTVHFVEGDMVEFHYELYKLSGEIISGTVGGRRMQIKIGEERTPIMGIDYVTRYLCEGESGFFLVTSDYAYGSEGYDTYYTKIKPFTPLAIKITDIKRVK